VQAAHPVATVDAGGELRVRRGSDERLLLDLRREPVTGLRLGGEA